MEECQSAKAVSRYPTGRGSRKRVWREQEIAAVLQFLGFLVGHSEFRAGDSV
jgi:hypothetical protein